MVKVMLTGELVIGGPVGMVVLTRAGIYSSPVGMVVFKIAV